MAKKFADLIAKMPPEARAEIEAYKQAYRAEMALQELRQARQKSQEAIAKTLGGNQASVSKMERRADMYVSTLRRFIKATRMSYEAAMADPNAAITAGLKAKPDLERSLSLAQLKAGLTLVKGPDGTDKPVGWMSAKDWDGTLALMKEFQDLKTDLPAASFWTNDLLPQ